MPQSRIFGVANMSFNAIMKISVFTVSISSMIYIQLGLIKLYIYGKCSNNFLFLFSAKMLAISLGIH